MATETQTEEQTKEKGFFKKLFNQASAITEDATHYSRLGIQGLRNATAGFIGDVVGGTLAVGAAASNYILLDVPDAVAEAFGGDLIKNSSGFGQTKAGWKAGMHVGDKLEQGANWVFDNVSADNIILGKVQPKNETEEKVIEYSEMAGDIASYAIPIGVVGKSAKGTQLIAQTSKNLGRITVPFKAGANIVDDIGRATTTTTKGASTWSQVGKAGKSIKNGAKSWANGALRTGYYMGVGGTALAVGEYFSGGALSNASTNLLYKIHEGLKDDYPEIAEAIKEKGLSAVGAFVGIAGAPKTAAMNAISNIAEKEGYEGVALAIDIGKITTSPDFYLKVIDADKDERAHVFIDEVSSGLGKSRDELAADIAKNPKVMENIEISLGLLEISNEDFNAAFPELAPHMESQAQYEEVLLAETETSTEQQNHREQLEEKAHEIKDIAGGLFEKGKEKAGELTDDIQEQALAHSGIGGRLAGLFDIPVIGDILKFVVKIAVGVASIFGIGEAKNALASKTDEAAANSTSSSNNQNVVKPGLSKDNDFVANNTLRTETEQTSLNEHKGVAQDAFITALASTTALDTTHKEELANNSALTNSFNQTNKPEDVQQPENIVPEKKVEKIATLTLDT